MSPYKSTRKTRRSVRWLHIVAALTTASVLAACGGGEKATVTKADTSGVDAAKATVTKFSVRPSAIPIKAPVGKKIPSGKKLVFINCGVEACNLESAIIKGAADQLGWTLTTINTNGSPEQIKAAWGRVAREKPDGVLYTGTERSTFDAELAQVQKNGTVVAGCCTPDAVGNGIDFMASTPDQVGPIGDLQAAWVVAQSGGKADSVYIDVPAFKILSQLTVAYKEGMKKYCSTCTVDTMEMPITAFGKDIPSRIVSYLRAHPKVKYIGLSLDDMAIGLPGALSAAGLTDVKIVGQGATSTNLQYIGSGQQGASVAFPYYEIMWSMVDAVARKVTGVSIEKGEAPPVWLLNKDNLPSTTKLFPVVADQDAQFKALWGLG